MNFVPTSMNAVSSPGWSRGRQIIAIGLVVAAILLLVIVTRVAALFQPAPPPAPAAVPGAFHATPDQFAALHIQTVGGGNADLSIPATGTIAVDEDHSTPVVPPYSGQVTQILVEPGARVFKGQPLLKIRAPEFVDSRNALFAAAAARTSALSQLRVAQTGAQRAEEIYKTAGGSLRDYQSAQNDLAVAQAGVRTAEAALAAARDKMTILGKSPDEVSRLEAGHDASGGNPEVTLRAPIGGVIASRNVAVGQFLATGAAAPAFVITDPVAVWLVAQVPETATAQIRLGDAVTVTTSAYPGRTFAARVDNIGVALDPTTHRLPVRATIANPDGALRPQMFASFQIRVHPGAATDVTIPASAVIHEGDDARVWVAEPGNILRARTVTVGAASGDAVRVLSGLRQGERIVTAGALFVNEAGLPG